LKIKINLPQTIFLVFVVFVIFFRHLQTLPDVSDGQLVRLTGRVSTEPVYYEYSQGIRLSGFWFYLPLYPRVNYGDEIVVEGIVADYKLDDPKLIEHIPNNGLIFRAREQILEFYNHVLPIPHSSLVSGMVLGSKSGLTQGFWEDLKSTGTAHVVVASGMNVTLVATFLINILVLFVRRKRAIVLALVGIWIYTVLAGFDAPVVRAAIMGSIAFTAQALGKITTAWRGLVVSALVMLLIKPQWIADLGFILSFVATASLMIFELPARNRLRKVPNVIREHLSTSLAAQVGVAPILIFAFGQFNPLAPFINAIILWSVAPITVIAGLSGIVSLIFPPIARIMLIFVYPLTTWFVGMVEIFS